MRKKIILFAILLFCFIPLCSGGTIIIPEVEGAAQGTINAAIASASTGDILQLQGTTYTLSGSIYLKTGVTLSGSKGTVLLARSYEDFKTAGAGMIYFNGVENAGISNLKIDGSERGSSQHDKGGKDWQDAIVIGKGSKEILISDVTFAGLVGDGVRGDGSGSSNVRIYNCVFNTVGHDGVQNWHGNKWVIENCYFNLFINSGVRIANAVDCVIKGNYFTCNTGSGFVGVELEDNIEGVSIYNNKFENIQNKYGIGIATVRAQGTANIHNNTFINCPGGAMRVSGIKVIDKGNSIDSNSVTENVDKNNSTNGDTTEGKVTPTEVIGEGSMRTQFSFESFEALFGSRLVTAENDRDLSIRVLNESSDDLRTAAQFAKGSKLEKEYAYGLLQESELKEQFARDLFALSLNHASEAKELILQELQRGVNENCSTECASGVNENCTPC